MILHKFSTYSSSAKSLLLALGGRRRFEVATANREFMLKKEVYCAECGDVEALRMQERSCICGISKGHTEEGCLDLILGPL